MANKIELSSKQKDIVCAENCPIYVKASAGSGKTRVLTERVRYLLNKTRKEILTLTFTNKASEEIKQRLKEIPDLEKRTFMGTFHSFCKNMLEHHGSLIGFSKMPDIFETEADRLKLVEQAIAQIPSYAIQYRAQNEKAQKKQRYAILEYISKVKRALIPDSELEHCVDDENMVLVYQNYQDLLHSQNAIDFDDLILYAYNLLINFPKTAALYRRSFFAICIDEAQDLNNAQYQLLLALANSKFTNIMMVGDPNQSIYHFTGSSPDYMDKKFVNDFQPRIFELQENYRSSKAILSAAQKIIPEAEYIANTIKDGLFQIELLDNEEAEAMWVAKKICELIESKTHADIEGDITCEKIAILARNKYLFKPIAKQLELNSLPFYYKTTPGSIEFESDLMKVFELALRVKLNSFDNLHKHKLLNYLNLNLDSSQNDDLQTIKDKTDDCLLKSILTVVLQLSDDGRNIKKIMANFKDSLNIDNENKKALIINDIDELLIHWSNYAKNTDAKSMQHFKNAMALGQTHPLAQHSGITLSTIHAMKGQEFDIVFVIGLDDGTLPDYRSIEKNGIEMIQEKNNLYVAFTRAKRFLFVTWPQQRTMPWGDIKNREVSRFLKDF